MLLIDVSLKCSTCRKHDFLVYVLKPVAKHEYKWHICCTTCDQVADDFGPFSCRPFDPKVMSESLDEMVQSMLKFLITRDKPT